MKKLFPVFYLFLLFASIPAQDKTNIAVLDLEGSLSTSELLTLTSKLTVELMNTGRYTVIERSQMQEILKEQGFQQTGCTNTECAVQMGQLLGVQMMVAGNIGKIGSMFSIGLRTIDVETGKIEKNISVDFKGSIEDVLISGIRKAVSSLTGIRMAVQISDLGDVGAGDIYVSSDPSGGEICLDGMLVEGRKTPATIQTVPAGNHTIEVKKGVLVGSKSIKLEKDDLAKIQIRLEQGTGGLTVISSPPEAGLVRRRKIKKIFRYSFWASTAVTGAISGISYMNANEKYDEYNNAKSNGPATALGDEVDSHKSKAVIYGIASGVLGGVSVILTF
jgi:hypothetical protein